MMGVHSPLVNDGGTVTVSDRSGSSTNVTVQGVPFKFPEGLLQCYLASLGLL